MTDLVVVLLLIPAFPFTIAAYNFLLKFTYSSGFSRVMNAIAVSICAMNVEILIAYMYIILKYALPDIAPETITERQMAIEVGLTLLTALVFSAFLLIPVWVSTIIWGEKTSPKYDKNILFCAIAILITAVIYLPFII